MPTSPSVALSKSQQRALALREAMGGLHVLSVGVSNYSAVPNFRTLSTPEHDARAVADCFRDVHQLNAAKDDITILPGAARPSRGAILAAVKALAARASAKDRLLFYFSGHGIRLSSDPESVLYLVPEDAYADDEPDALVAYQQVVDSLNRSAAKQKLIVLDACHSGPDTQNLKVRAATFSHSALVKYVESVSGVAVLASSPKTKPSSARSPNPSLSLMTHFLVAALRGARDALDAQGHLTVSSLFDYVAVNVQRQAAQYQHVQQPVVDVRATGEIVLGDFSSSIVDPTSFDVGAYPVTEIEFESRERARPTDVLTALTRKKYSVEYISRRVNDVLPEHLEELMGRLVAKLRKEFSLTAGSVHVEGAGVIFPGGAYAVAYESEDQRSGTMVHQVTLFPEWFSRPGDIPRVLDCLGVQPSVMTMNLQNTIQPEGTVAGLEAKGWAILSELPGKIVARNNNGTRIVVKPDAISLEGFAPSELFGETGPNAVLIAQTLTRMLSA